MRLACEARALHVPRETPSLPRTSDSSFKDSSTYTIYPIVLSLDSLSTSSPHNIIKRIYIASVNPIFRDSNCYLNISSGF